MIYSHAHRTEEELRRTEARLCEIAIAVHALRSEIIGLHADTYRSEQVESDLVARVGLLEQARAKPLIAK